ncbi:hypothetical protein V1514DRAFT_311878 [Lipomyces japonicus]|uniref:uncharacterized protein n=1 Tax=Lipomyces japonicus TaxID=56871 RepID=UPI0034CE1EBE
MRVMTVTTSSLVHEIRREQLLLNSPTASRLPYECLVGIFNFLQPEHLAACAQVCRAWHSASSDSRLWTTIDLSHLRSYQLNGNAKTSSLHLMIQKFTKHLSIRNPHFLTGSDITCVLRTLAGVTGFSIEDILNKNFVAINNFDAPRLPALKTFKLENYSRVNTRALALFLSVAGPALSHVSFHGTHIDTTVIDSLTHNRVLCRSLKELNLAFTGISSHAVYLLSDHMSNLNNLMLSGNLAVAGHAIDYLLSCSDMRHKLERLDLRFIWGLEAVWFIKYFTHRPNGLHTLDIRGCEHFTKKDLVGMTEISPATNVLNSIVLEDDSIEGYRKFVNLLAASSATNIQHGKSTTRVCTTSAIGLPSTSNLYAAFSDSTF